MLEDAAARCEGQVYLFSNGDMALLFRPGTSAAGLLDMLARLFRADMPDPTGLRSLWQLPQTGAAALAFMNERVSAGDRAAPGPEPLSSTSMIAAMDRIVQTGLLSDLMYRQTAILLRPGQSIPIVPLFREVAISTAVLEGRISGSDATADPFLFSHLAVRLDYRMLHDLQHDIPAGGLLSLGLGSAALHINMTLSGILSQGFADFAAACPKAIAAGLRIGVEVPFVEAFADIKAFIVARERLRLAGLHLVLDGVSHQVLALACPGVLEPSLVKLIWSPAMRDAGPALGEAVARLGPERIVLHRSDGEAAMAWGMAHGISRFQGRYVDAMLAAERMRTCASAHHCSLRQCRERASATGNAGRAGCRNLQLLDLGAAMRLKAAAPQTASPQARVPDAPYAALAG